MRAVVETSDDTHAMRGSCELRKNCAFSLVPGPPELERDLHEPRSVTTFGQLVSALFSKYERQFHDEQVAAVATQVALDELLRAGKVRKRQPA
jgi:hypothetical protein